MVPENQNNITHFLEETNCHDKNKDQFYGTYYVVLHHQVDMSVVRKGSSVALPYWDWTLPTDPLPSLFTEQTFYDAWKDEVLENPFARGFIKEISGYTVRDPQPELLKLSADGEHSVLFDEVSHLLGWAPLRCGQRSMRVCVCVLVGGVTLQSLMPSTYQWK